jgi:hypothetical protein
MLTDLLLPPSYRLDELDPDVVVLRRQDGTFVAAFSVQGATKEGILAATTPGANENKEQDG